MEPADGAAVPVPVLLPDAVRRHLADLAAVVLGELPEPEVPAALRRVRAFAPARRAKAGAGPLAVLLDRDPVFRHRVGAAWRAIHSDLADALDSGQVPPAADPEFALAGVYLLRPGGWEHLVEVLATALTDRATEQRGRDAEASARKDIAAAIEEARRSQAALASAQAQIGALEEDLATARRELRRLRSDADRARAAARVAEQQAAVERERSAALAADRQAAAGQAADRLRDAEERAEQARRSAREGRSLADTRVRLLLDTVVEAAAGLRRELALPPPTVRPADLVGPAASGSTETDAPPLRAYAADDPATLDYLLALPQVHLVVDGYNVTKTGYGSLPLIDQRHRLLDGLAVMAARTASEVTCCFDGADVDARPATRLRGVRVLFSEPGMTADELIRRLVRAEPPGRPVVVVSSDAEVVAGVRAAGARAVPAAALLRLLGRG